MFFLLVESVLGHELDSLLLCLSLKTCRAKKEAQVVLGALSLK